MSIKIIPQQELENNNTTSVVNKIPLLFYPTPKLIYQHRYERLLQLAKNNPFADYLQFCAIIAKTQNQLIQNNPIHCDLTNITQTAAARDLSPLSLENYPLTEKWLEYFYPILESVKEINESITKTINTLAQYKKPQLMEKAQQLLQGDLTHIDSGESLFIWAALSVYYAQLASKITGKAVAQLGEKRFLCPVCNSEPTASVIHLGSNAGLRYLHCGLCETQWHVPRVKCTNCDNLAELTYFSLNDEKSPVKTECCDHCHSYLKIFNQECDPHIEVVADDIASLMLDMKTEEAGYTKSGINPFLFANQPE